MTIMAAACATASAPRQLHQTQLPSAAACCTADGRRGLGSGRFWRLPRGNAPLARVASPNLSSPKRACVRVRAEDSGSGKAIGSALKVGNQALDAAVQMLPSSIPRPIGKAGLGLLGFTVALSLLQAVFNSFVTLVILAGLGYGAFTYFSKEKSTVSSSAEDPLDEARKIMDKYK